MFNQQLWLSPSIHPVYARLICAELRRRGFSDSRILEGTRLNWDTLHHDNRFLSFDQMHRLVLHALTLSQCPWLGIEVGRHTDVRSAVGIINRYSSLRQNIAAFRVDPQQPTLLVLDERLILPELREYLLGHFTTGILRLLETATGLPLHQQLTLHWPMPETAWSAAYRQVAGTVLFGSDQLRLELPEGYLDSPCLAADPEAERLALRDCENQLQRLVRGGSLSERIKQRLLSCESQYPTLEQMAAQEHMAPRTLIRHLSDEGVRYQTLLDDVRCDLSRTFRRWLGVTPRGFRQQARRTPSAFDADTGTDL